MRNTISLFEYPELRAHVPNSIKLEDCETEIERRCKELEILSAEVESKLESLKHNIQKAICVTNVLDQELYEHKEQGSIAYENRFNQDRLREYFRHVYLCSKNFNTFISQ